MEVAGQWRREWAGTAEYGKVTEGGVTKRVARAMEVLNASGPGARVRVLRAAYHSTSGPGIPASSYMLQSSRRVISSGYNFVEPTTLPSKPLEISSIPLEIAIETESNGDNPNYKVTEPDDIEISEPSKWRSATGKSSIRFPSEESSSTDNASIIDLDSRSHRSGSFRSHTFDDSHEKLKITNPKNNRVSPLLDAPVTLSTLKYKSLLNGSDDWNNRRKSYSFEDTTPLNKNIIERIDRFAIESSTDSGICKSSEVVNDVENTRYHKPTKERKSVVQDETFKDWLVKNRINQSSHLMKPLKERSITPDRHSDNNITLQSSGKVCITLPVTIEAEDNDGSKKPQIGDDNDRKSKKVEFCKTELHFAADTGTVNIIATDEKPPPTNDFRRRRSAFVPINDRFEKSVTLFGEKTDFSGSAKIGFNNSYNVVEISDSDENTAATKSILKNKIPKPKPYLLGENMNLGNENGIVNKSVDKNTSVTGVSLINSQLKIDGKYNREISSDYSSPKRSSIDVTSNNSYRSTNEGTLKKGSFRKHEQISLQSTKKLETVGNILTNSIKTKLQVLQSSPTLGRPNTRQLRESDLTYFGVEKNQVVPTSTLHEDQESSLYDNYNEQEEIFESVRLVRKASSSVCSSEIESDEAPEYQNVPSKLNYAPVPAPRLRTKYSINQSDTKTGNLNSIKEQENDDNVAPSSRRSRLRRLDSSSPLNRSISEPPKARSRHRELEHYNKTNASNSTSSRMKSSRLSNNRDLQDGTLSEDSTLYVNLTPKESIEKDHSRDYKTDTKRKSLIKKETNPKLIKEHNTERSKARRTYKNEDSLSSRPVRRSDSASSKTNTYDNSPLRNKPKIQRTEKLVTPELSSNSSRRIHERNHKTNENYVTNPKAKDRITKSLNQHTNSDNTHSNTLKREVKATREPGRGDTKQNKHSLINNNNLNNISHTLQPEVHMTLSSKVKETERKHYDAKKSRRNEYVINYDDKNGIVSSVRKFKPVKPTFDPKKNSAKANKENSNEQNGRMKQLNKIALQQIAEQQRDQYEKSYMDKTSKRKTHVHKPCQLL